MYADDTQLYITMSPTNQSSMLNKIDTCVKDIKAWMIANYLSLNENKTEVLHITSRFSKLPSISQLIVGNANITPAKTVRLLHFGEILHSYMSHVLSK